MKKDPFKQPSEWVERTLASLSLDEKIWQMMHPAIEPRSEGDFLCDYLAAGQPGGLFLFQGTMAEFTHTTGLIQKHLKVPAVISSDLENGAGRFITDTTQFPELTALGATRNEEYAYQMGRATAIEGRAFGVHWAFAPLVDINLHPHNPITNTRTLGDDPDNVSALSGQLIRGMQENGLCATAKHFPGDGYDDRDQHICTSINPLSMEQWYQLSGKMFMDAIRAGVWSIMIGHIALPAWDNPQPGNLESAPPATLSRKIVTDLLRDKMGFNGVIITDAMVMGGITLRAPRAKIIPGVIEAGCDIILFSELPGDFLILKQAVEQGRIPEEKINDSVRRILRLKELLGLNKDPGPRPLGDRERNEFAAVSKRIARDAITLVRKKEGVLPLKLGPGTKVLSYHLRANLENTVDMIDKMLTDRGVTVSRFTEQDVDKLPSNDEVMACDAILVHLVYGPLWNTNCIRPTGYALRDLNRIMGLHHPRLVFISYGSPYHIYDYPHTPVFINAYSADKNTQSAVLQFLTGEIPANGKSPVNLEKAYHYGIGPM
ncbi:MAG: glycoside hydrolase family 3 protein [Sedimentisphaerales bacterium]|nr:glycoside hydrolase family 3 protein [Sedimentisphaerales bacterium]